MPIEKKQIKVGVTGAIGAGKTFVSSIFEKLGFPVFNSDIEAKKCMQSDVYLIEQIKVVFGDKVYENNILQKNILSEIIFNDNDKLKSLNHLIHPVVSKNFINWCGNQNSDIIIKEAAILFESGSNNILDKIICVSAKEDIRIKRVMSRDKCDKNHVLSIMSKQMTQKEKEKLSDFIIINDDKKLLMPQIIDVITKIS
ncbi:MAG: dephospho-CoA kinase [Flavobacteriales bacterium]|jgi:dephospho-CoA kinase|nr:dephospho-CoA kinase [Flavobacteriales bacterium]